MLWWRHVRVDTVKFPKSWLGTLSLRQKIHHFFFSHTWDTRFKYLPEGCPYMLMYSALHIMQWFSHILGATIFFGMGGHKYPKLPRQYFCDPPISQKKFLWPPYPRANIFLWPLPLKKIGTSFNDWWWTASYAGWSTGYLDFSCHAVWYRCMCVSCQHQR